MADAGLEKLYEKSYLWEMESGHCFTGSTPSLFARVAGEVGGGKKVLDFGCGRGELLSILKARGNEVCGVDYSANAVAVTRRKGIRAFVSKTLRTKFPKDSFDAVVSTEVIEHLVDTGAFIDECRRVLKPGGILVLSTPNLASASNRLKVLARKKPTFAEEELANSAGHLRLFTRGMLRSLLARHSLTVERMLGSRTIIPGTQVQLPDPVTRALPQFSEHIIVVARK